MRQRLALGSNIEKDLIQMLYFRQHRAFSAVDRYLGKWKRCLLQVSGQTPSQPEALTRALPLTKRHDCRHLHSP